MIQLFPDSTNHQRKSHKTHEESMMYELSITIEFRKMDKIIKFLMYNGTIVVVIFLILAICFWIKIEGSWLGYETKPVKLKSKKKQVPMFRTSANIESSQETDLVFDHRDTDV